ncbi:hypothetical protein [Algoriphagus chordae]|uniref:Uncharacterized protein n=1 Tax=Algoriphagus chordae TaxID=237019 RepID=A0A2W7REK6_9BACT|nr:hypothetical protein [Algoriphagus chordae]PZX54057.1 hypothetical protein LV85_01396 [Algoriphagus chordae]
MKESKERIFRVGETVYSKVAPTIKLIVRKHYANIYYCMFDGHPERKELALFEREIVH